MGRPLIGHLAVIAKYMKDNNKLALGRLNLAVKADEGLDVYRMTFFGMELTMVTFLLPLSWFDWSHTLSSSPPGLS